MLVLAIDLSTKCGWSYLEDGKLIDYGLIVHKVPNFNVNDDPNKQKGYPFNIAKAADEMAMLIFNKYSEKRPDKIVIENTVKGRNRHTQRLIEWYHKSLIDNFKSIAYKVNYMDPSEWRSILAMRLTNEDKKNNKSVKQGLKRGKITKKHLSVRLINEMFDLKLKLKDNDIADSIALGAAFNIKVSGPASKSLV
jgi:hypothetical protein